MEKQITQQITKQFTTQITQTTIQKIPQPEGIINFIKEHPVLSSVGALAAAGFGAFKLNKWLKKKQDEQKQIMLGDPAKIAKKMEELFVKFVSGLPTCADYQNSINFPPELKNSRICVLVGKISVGKSSVYNWAFNLKLKVTPNETTDNLQLVYSNKQEKILYYDTIGFSQYATILHSKQFAFFFAVTNVFVLEDVSFKNCLNQLRIFNHINPQNLCIVKTKCDQYLSQDAFNEMKKKDRSDLDQMGIKQEVLYISVKMKDDFEDNLTFKKLLYGSKMEIADVISFQSAEGFWKKVWLIEKLFGLELMSEVRKDPEVMLIVTYLIGKWIEKNYPGNQYSLIVKKAFKYIEKNTDLKKLSQRYDKYLI